MHSVLIINPDGTCKTPGPAEDYEASARTEGGELFAGSGTLAIGVAASGRSMATG